MSEEREQLNKAFVQPFSTCLRKHQPCGSPRDSSSSYNLADRSRLLTEMPLPVVLFKGTQDPARYR
jgi:hypothetical protein